jgi:hypothetical protein
MTISITITDGTETVTLTATDGLNESWTPVTPGIDDDSVTETIEVTLIGGNAAVAANIAELERLFQGARERVGGAYGIAYTYLKVTLDSAVWRSPVLDGRIVTANDQWIKGDWALGQRSATILITREAWWEADSEVQIPVTNPNGASVTTGLNVFNCGDGVGTSPLERRNEFKVLAADVVGDLPAPVRLEIKNRHATAALYDVMIGQNVFSDPLSFNNWYEGAITGETVVSDSSMSGGSYSYKTATSISISVELTSIAAALKGGYYRILARQNAAGTWKIQPYSLIPSVYTYGKKITTTVSSGNFWWWDLGVVRLPPLYIPGLSYYLLMAGWTATGGVGDTYSVDCFQLTPLDGWKRVILFSSLVLNETLVLDEILGNVYGLYSTGTVKTSATMTGDALKVYPNKVQIFFLVWNSSPTTSDITGVVEVKLFYRPRRRTL